MDEVRVVAVGTGGWVVALIVLLPFSGRLAAGGHSWWLATCLVGIGLGLLGTLYCRRRATAARRRRGADDLPPPVEPLT